MIGGSGSGSGLGRGIPARIVADLSAGRREVERRLSIAMEALRARGLDADVERVGGPGEVADAIGPPRADGFAAILGDDRSIRTAVSALAGSTRIVGRPADLLAGASPQEAPVLGVLAAHPHVDFVRTFGIPPDQPAFAADRLLSAPDYPIDVAKVTYVDDHGGERTTYFAGLAEVGFGGAVLRREAGAWIRRTAAFSAFWRTELTYRSGEVTLAGERREFSATAHDVIVANTQYGRHGIRLSPRSFPGDGAFELLIMTGPKSQQVRLLPKMFQGEHLPDDSIVEHRVRHVTIDAARPLPLHADGEYLGHTPASIELLPGAITLRI